MKTTDRLRTLALLIALWLPSSGVTQSSDPQALVQGFAAAWNAHDADAFEKLFSAQADWVTAAGSRVKGHAAIRDYLSREHQTWARTTTMRASNVVVRLLAPDVAVILFEWEIARAQNSAGKVAAPSRGNNIFVATRQDDQWIVVAGQVASLRL